MADFLDATGKEWNIFIDIPAVKKLREHDLDVLALFDDQFRVFEKIVGDPVRLVDTLWLICESQADADGVDELEFAKSLHGDALMRAVHALVEGVSDFFPDPKRRSTIKAMFRKIYEAEATILDNAAAQIEETSSDQIAEMMQIEFGKKSGESRDSSESTPA